MVATEKIQLIDRSDWVVLVKRLIVIWALSEAALGGVLHALKIPLTGIFINSTAVMIIALIAFYSNKNTIIIKATLIVLLVKAAVSPHTPLNAYLALSLQGIIGAVIFYNNQYFKLKCIIFAVLTLFLSGIQRIIVITILYGENLWESIDLFANYVLKTMPFNNQDSVNYEFSIWLIVFYVVMHILFGFIIGVFAGNLPNKLNNLQDNSLITLKEISDINLPKKKKRKFWLKKPSGIAVLILVAVILILTYVYPEFSEQTGIQVIIMIFRSIVIMIIWYLIAGPFLLKLYKNYINKHSTKYNKEVDFTIQFLPTAKKIVQESWKLSVKYRNLIRIQKFILITIFNMLVIELPQNGKNIPADRSNK